MQTDTHDPWLMTPGPLTTSRQTKEAMLHDWGSRDAAFIETSQRVRDNLLGIADAKSSHVCIPIQGSGTFAVEATIATLLPRDGKALVLINGAYGHRMVRIIEYLGRAYTTLETAEDTPPALDELDRVLRLDPQITHVLVVHCETTSGILNPLQAIAGIVASHQRHLVIDAMSAFGAIALSAREVQFDALMASSNKCLEGVPGLGFAIVRRTALETCKGNAHSLSLDLYDQWVTMEQSGQWRFTPPTHVIFAFDKALEQFLIAGGVPARFARYNNNRKILVDGLRQMGFETLLPDHLQAPVIVTVRMPADPALDFQVFYDRLKEKGYIIYPGKLTVAPSFRIGCIGALDETHMEGLLGVIRETIKNMGLTIGEKQYA